MKVTETECKIMEVRKYSAEYFDLDSKFRRPHIELITAYAIQNPFLFGCYELRKEQMKMQFAGTKHSVKEKYFYYPAKLDSSLEMIARYGFTDKLCGSVQGSTFYTNSQMADETLPGFN